MPLLVLLLALPAWADPQPAQDDPLINVVAEELTRIQNALKDEATPPYWMAVEVVDIDTPRQPAGAHEMRYIVDFV